MAIDIISRGMSHKNANDIATANSTLATIVTQLSVNVKSYNAKGDDSTDDTAAIQSAIDVVHAAGGGTVFFPKGTYKITAPLKIYSNITLVGVGSPLSVIRKTTNTLGENITVAHGNGNDNYAVDSVLSFYHDAGVYTAYVKIKGIRFRSLNGAAYGIFAPHTRHCEYNDMEVWNANQNFYTMTSWMWTMENVLFQDGQYGLYINDPNAMGTSLTANRVYANNCTQGGFYIYGLNYSSFNGCGCDHCTGFSYDFGNCKGIAVNGCGAEFYKCALRVNDSFVTVNGFSSQIGTGATSGNYGAVNVIGTNAYAVLNTCRFEDWTTVNNAYNIQVYHNAKAIFNNCILPTNGNADIGITRDSGYKNGMATFNDINGTTMVNQYGTGILVGGKKWFYGTAAPTTGTWAVGDRMIHSTPAVGQPKAWCCTVAGTPGTWVSEGNL
jgi:hypothetical protein